MVAVLTSQAVLPAGVADGQKNDKESVGFWRFEGETDAKRKADSSKNNNKIAAFDCVEFVAALLRWTSRNLSVYQEGGSSCILMIITPSATIAAVCIGYSFD